MRSFLLEVSWGEGYPDTPPSITLDSFYNKHLREDLKQAICSSLQQEAEGMLGTAMTYSLFEHAKENAEELVTVAPPTATPIREAAGVPEAVKGRKEKREVLSKRAKRRMADRTNAQGELPRGWDWVDIISHLSKTGVSQKS